MRISDWSSDVCSSDLGVSAGDRIDAGLDRALQVELLPFGDQRLLQADGARARAGDRVGPLGHRRVQPGLRDDALDQAHLQRLGGGVVLRSEARRVWKT